MSAELAICYVADLNFLSCSLMSLRSLRQFVPASMAEVYLFYLNPDEAVLERVKRALSKYDTTIVPFRIDEQIDIGTKSWNKTHVPRSALGRFYIEPHLPRHIERLLYIDGDTLFVRDPSDLIRFVPPENGLAAVDDISFFARNDFGNYGSATRTYFAGLGIDGSEGYFNSGLLLARRDAWKAIVAEAAQFFDSHSDKCKYHDQSALNAVIGARRVRLSPKWNFQTPFCNWNIRDETNPCVFHFTEFPKPWMGEVAPWAFLGGAIHEAMSEFADLGLPFQTLSPAEVERYDALKLEQAHRLATRMPVRLFFRRREFRHLLATAAV